MKMFKGEPPFTEEEMEDFISPRENPQAGLRGSVKSLFKILHRRGESDQIGHLLFETYNDLTDIKFKKDDLPEIRNNMLLLAKKLIEIHKQKEKEK